MSKGMSYFWVFVLGLIGILFGLRAAEVAVFGGLTAYNVGRIVSQTLLWIICLWGAGTNLEKARRYRAGGP